jgi:hypothetical protein
LHAYRRGHSLAVHAVWLLALTAAAGGATQAAAAPLAKRPPVNSAPPKISGTPEELQTLKASTGTWKESPATYAYQWQRCDAGGGTCADVPGATAATYPLAFADVGATMRVRVSAANSAGSSSATSAASTAVRAVSLTLPVRAAFYYAWYPEGWSSPVHYTPSLGFYDSGNTTVIKKQIAAMQYGGIQAGIYSWDRTNTTNNAVTRFPTFLSASQGTGFKWAIYYEAEGYGDPSAATIQDDLEFMRANYWSSPNYLRVGGRPVVFVYSSPGDGCDMAARWGAANTLGAYVVLSDPWVDNEPQLSSLTPYDQTYTGAVRVAAGDLDGDGKAEIVTAPGTGVPATVTVSSGAGTRLGSFVAADLGNAGAYLAVGDVAGDAQPEIVVGAADGSRIDVFSYRDGTASELTSFAPGLPNGGRVAVGDLNGDGKGEIVGATGAGVAPQVAIFAGDGTRVGAFAPYDATFTQGVNVAAGDVTGDGRADVVLGSGNGSRTEVRVVDATGAALVTPFEAYPGFGGALTVATADVDGDGRLDVVTAAAGGPHVRTFTVRQGRPSGLGSFFAYDSSTRGQVFVAAADVAGEATPDIVAGSAAGQPNQVRVFGNVRDCAGQPDAWHEYLVTASGEAGMGKDAFTISPGLWRASDSTPSLPRDLARWNANVADLKASGASWQLIVSFDEWIESTAVESATQWASASGYGQYLDALHGLTPGTAPTSPALAGGGAAAAVFPLGHQSFGMPHPELPAWAVTPVQPQ